MQRKFKRIFGAAGNTTHTFVKGFQMGALVGGGVGLMVGTYSAIQMRSFMYIPLSMIGSAVPFGCFMGLGLAIRSSDM